MSPQDKKKLGIGIGLLLVAAAILYFAVLRRSGGEVPVPPTPAASTSSTPTAPAAAPPAAGGVPTAGAPAPGLMDLAAAPGAAPGGPMSPPPGVQGPLVKPRPDPFQLFPPRPEDIPPPPAPPPFIVVARLPGLGHKVGYVPAWQREQSDETVKPRTGQRMAGVLWNGQVWAILENNTGSYIVKPGDSVGEARVQAIGRGEMVVADATGKQDVQLRGLALPPSAVQPGAAAPGYGQPGLPSWRPEYGGVSPRTSTGSPGATMSIGGRSRSRRDRDDEE